MDFASAPSSLSLPARRGSEPLVAERMSLPEPPSLFAWPEDRAHRQRFPRPGPGFLWARRDRTEPTSQAPRQQAVPIRYC